MDSGYYAACAGLRAQSQALEVAANNLANLTTGGYRAQRATFQSLLAASSGGQTNNLNTAINDFGVLGGTHTDLSPGSLERTGNPLDLGIEGQGFFAVETERGVLYTRSGNFHVSPQGKLVDAQGAVVQGAQGAMAVPAGVVSISPDGTLSVSGAVAGRLRVIDFASGTLLQAEGDAYYSAPKGSGKPATQSYIRQGMIEGSNVSPVGTVVDLIAVQRSAEMMQRVLSTFHSEFNRIAAGELPRV